MNVAHVLFRADRQPQSLPPIDNLNLNLLSRPTDGRPVILHQLCLLQNRKLNIMSAYGYDRMKVNYNLFDISHGIDH